MEQLDRYFELQQEIYNYFGYQEDWVVIPLDDCREYYWYLTGESSGDQVYYSKEEFDLPLLEEGKEYYTAGIYTQRHLPKWVYRGQDYTLVCADTNTDGNKFLMVFDNSKYRDIKGLLEED